MIRGLALSAVLVCVLSGCTSGSDPSDSTSTAATTATTAATTVTPTTKTDEPVGWTPETIGTIAGPLGGIDSIAFAPDGAAAAFSLVDISCCSNRVHGWARIATGAWSAIETETGFVAGADGLGAYGGPTELAWFDGQFIAVGTRGGQSEPERVPTSTTWVSRNGREWTAFDDATGSRMSGLTVAVDGSVLLGVRTTDDGEAQIRSTKDGQSWTTVATVTTDETGTGFSSLSMSRLTLGTDISMYVLFGSMFTADGNGRTEPYASTSPDGRTWTPVLLSAPETASPRSFSVTDALALNGTLLLYGFGYGYAGEQDTEQLGWRVDELTNSVVFPVTQPCGGTFTSMVVDQRSPEPRMFAICSVVAGPVEGDSVDLRTELVVSGDGETFSSAPVTPPEWGKPSVDVNLGPVFVGANGSVTVGVASPNPSEQRGVVIWSS